VPEASALSAEFGHITKDGGSERREAIRELAQKYGISAREVFSLLERAKHSGD
jgi:hypothetical protein